MFFNGTQPWALQKLTYCYSPVGGDHEYLCNDGETGFGQVEGDGIHCADDETVHTI